MASAFSVSRNLFHRLWDEPPPSLAVEFSSGGVAAACWTPGAGTADRFTSEPLPEEALRPSMVRDNVLRPDEVRSVLAELLGRVSRRNGGNLAVLLPDVAARVSPLVLEQLPARREEAQALLRWRLKKTVPFEVEQASLAYQPLGDSPEGREVLVAVAPSGVVRQYEAALESLGYQPGFVTLSSLAAIGLLPSVAPGAGSGTMLLRSAGRLVTILATGSGKLRMFRSSDLPAEEQPRSLEEILADAYSSAVYFQDNFGETLERIYLAGFGEQTPQLQALIQQELDVRAQPLLVPGARSEDNDFLGLHGMIAGQAKQ